MSISPTPPTPPNTPTDRLPIVEEQLHITKHPRKTGEVVVHVVPTTERQSVDIPVTLEQAEVERVAVNRIVAQTEPPREEGDVTIIPIYEEVLVVEKRLLLKEEIRITRRRSTVTEHHEADVRREEVHILRASPKT